MHVVDTLLDFWNDVETELTPNLIERSHDTFPEIIIITVNVVKTKQSWRDFFAMRRRKTFDCCDISLLHALSAANSGGDARPKKTFTLPTLKIKCVPTSAGCPLALPALHVHAVRISTMWTITTLCSSDVSISAAAGKTNPFDHSGDPWASQHSKFFLRNNSLYFS